MKKIIILIVILVIAILVFKNNRDKNESIRELTKKVTELNNEIDNAKHNISNKEVDIEDLNSSIKDIQASLNEINTGKLKIYNKDEENKSNLGEDILNKISQVKNVIAQKQKQINESKKLSAEMKLKLGSEISALKEEIELNEVEITGLKEANYILEEANKNLTEIVSDLVTKNKELTDDVNKKYIVLIKTVKKQDFFTITIDKKIIKSECNFSILSYHNPESYKLTENSIELINWDSFWETNNTLRIRVKGISKNKCTLNFE